MNDIKRNLSSKPYSVHSFNATKSFVRIDAFITKMSLVVDASFISASAVTAFATT